MIKWTVALVTLFVLCALTCGILEYQFMAVGITNAEGESEIVSGSGVLYDLMTVPRLDTSNPIGFAWSAVVITGSFVGALWNMLWFNYSFFTGAWSIVRMVVFWPLSIAMILSIILAIRGTTSA